MIKDVRPTSNKVLLALFSIIGEKILDANFLDLFSGTGQVGREALKRGASSCVFVESVKARADSIRKQINSDNAIILSLDVRRALSWLVKRDKKFDIIFADPPYNSGWCEVLPKLANLDKVLAPDALFIVEHSIREPLSGDSHRYGETCLTFLKNAYDIKI